MEDVRSDPATVGAAVTTVVTAPLLLAAPAVIAFEPTRGTVYDLTGVWLWENPLLVLQFLGGILGGLVGGYLTRGNWYESAIHGLYGVGVGVGAVFLIDVVYRIGFAVVSGVFFPSLVLIVGFRRVFFFLVPFGMLYLFEGMLGSVLGYGIKHVITVLVTRAGASERTLAAIRGAIATSAFLGIFGAVWWFLFVTENSF